MQTRSKDGYIDQDGAINRDTDGDNCGYMDKDRQVDKCADAAWQMFHG